MFVVFLLLCSDKMFPVFGFGAKIPPTWQVIVFCSSARFSWCWADLTRIRDPDEYFFVFAGQP